MSKLRQVKVDNWGAFFLQRLKIFFNRTDYCDLTLQFQDNVQLKVHRLVLNACTEYFEILERTCEMYEDCLIMPDDLQTDVMLPIINFMYTGQLDYKQEILERLYQTSQIMNITVLSKLLDVQRAENNSSSCASTTTTSTRKVISTSNIGKRTHSNAFDSTHSRQNTFTPPPYKSSYMSKSSTGPSMDMTPYYVEPNKLRKTNLVFEKRPTRYEVPPELEIDNQFGESFSDISYDSKPLMVHPETRRYERKKLYHGIFSEASTSRKFDELQNRPSTSLDFVECKRIPNFNEEFEDENNDSTVFTQNASTSSQYSSYVNKDKLFDKVLDNQAKVTIETKGAHNPEKLDHAKIISEVLKKYPHLVKGNKNIRLKILPPKSSTPKTKKPATDKQQAIVKNPIIKKEVEYVDMSPREAEKIVKQGVNNTTGPWICMLCGAPGRYLLHSSYYDMRRHLVEVHREKPVSNLCEYCGMKCMKRNYLLHHMYTKHGVEPPATHNFPKCNKCNYIALTIANLAKHKVSHLDTFKCIVCFTTFKTSSLLLQHIQRTGHKISADRRQNYQCIYCMKQFLRESNLYTHLKVCHKEEAMCDGIIENSDEEDTTKDIDTPLAQIKQESMEYGTAEDVEFEIQKDGYIHLVTKQNLKQKILNQEFVTSNVSQSFTPKNTLYVGNSHDKHVSNEDIKILSNKELIVSPTNQYTVPRLSEPSEESIIRGDEKIAINKPENINQSIQIVVSNQEEYNALISSNPSIIFDNNTQGKTLTVLSASHATLEPNTSMDLDNSQNNEMIILQEEYPINVSEAVPTDNGNIVVLYDSTDNGQNKYIMNDQYGQAEILETQNINAQFVQTSAVITQNYETITTSTPMVGGQVLVQQPIMSWPTTVHHEILSNQHPFSITVKKPMTNVIELSNVDKTEMTLNEIEMGKPDNNTLLVIPSDEIGNENVETIVTSEDTTNSYDNSEQQIEETTQLQQKSINKIDLQNKIMLEWSEDGMGESESTVQVVESSSECVNEIPKVDGESLQNIEVEEVNMSTESDIEAPIHAIDPNYSEEQSDKQEDPNKELEAEQHLTSNSEAKEKINSLLIDWDENDSQNEEMATVEVTSTQLAKYSLEKVAELHLDNEQELPPDNETIAHSVSPMVSDENTQDSDKNTQVSDENTQDSEESPQVSNENTQMASSEETQSPVSDHITLPHSVQNEVSTSQADVAINKPETTNKNVNTVNNIKKLVSDWDEDEE